MCEKAVGEDGCSLKYVPREFRTWELCEKAIIYGSGSDLEFVPNEFKTKDLCRSAVTGCADAIEFVPPEFKNKRLCLDAFYRDNTTMRFIPKDFILGPWNMPSARQIKRKKKHPRVTLKKEVIWT